ncbi:MAG: hypothetical protein M5U34_14905 [Chloroflexi bacterium]|nr:hypothetical protein [Chloroflexota bacterium]
MRTRATKQAPGTTSWLFSVSSAQEYVRAGIGRGLGQRGVENGRLPVS